VRKPAAAGIWLALALLLIACSGGGAKSDDQKLRDGLQAMVIQQADIPAGFQPLSGDFADNAQAASGIGGGPSEQQLNAWGRLLGYQRDFQAGAPSSESVITALSTSVSLYRTDQGASDSFTDRVASARLADWKASHADLTDFQQQELKPDVGADDMLWLRFTGHKETAPGKTQLIADDQIIFRVGRAWDTSTPSPPAPRASKTAASSSHKSRRSSASRSSRCATP